MIPVDVAPVEAHQFSLLLRRCGVDPESFKLRKLVQREGGRYKVRVVGRGAATVYEAEAPGEWTSMFAADLESGLFGLRPTTPPPPPAIAEALRRVEVELAERGLLGALRYLNTRVPHRFTGVYRLDGPMMRMVSLADKHLHLDPLDLKLVPLKDSFCQFTLRDSLFVTPNTGTDERLVGHPYSGVLNSYIGVPVASGPGKLLGTLCHFDFDAHPVSDDEFLLLERVGHLLPGLIKDIS